MSRSGKRMGAAFPPRLSLSFAAVCLFFVAESRGLAQHTLTHHVRQAVSSGEARIAGRLPSKQLLRLDIVLPLRDRAGLEEFLQALYDPSGPSYRHFLTVSEFTARFGPTEEDYKALSRYVAAYGLNIVGGSRDGMDIQVEGPVAAVESAFSVSLSLYRHPSENRAFYAPDREPTVGLPFPLWHISGLDNYSIPHPMFSRRSESARARSLAPDAVMPQAVTGSGPSGSFLGSDMRAAYYGGTALTGAGQNLGLLEFGGTNLADLNIYFGNAGQTNTVPITLLSTDGTSAACLTCDDTEQTLDMTQALGMAPGLSSLVVYIGAHDTAILSALTTHNPLPTTIGNSWSWHPPDPSTLDPYLERMAAQGQTFFSASGDGSTWSTAWAWPADDAYVVAVGGTDLTTLSAGGAWASETAWGDSGGGVSPDGVAIPVWQQSPGVINAGNNGSKTLRNGPDVSANADYSFFVCANQTCTANELGGTSFSAPMWAAYMALVNQQTTLNGNPPVGFINPSVYSIGLGSGYNADFHDVTGGSSGSFSAVPGYDLVTGWGSPNGLSLINALADTPASGNFTLSASPGSVSVIQGKSGTSTVTSSVSGGFNSIVLLSASGQPAGVTASFSPSSIAAPGSGTSTITLIVASNATPGSYPITITGAGASMTQPVTTVFLTVVPTPSFEVSASPASVSAGLGGIGTSTITTAVFGGFNAAVALSASGLPSGVTVTFSPSSIAAPGSGTSTMTFTVSGSTPVGTYPVTVTGTGGNLHGTAIVSLTIAVPAFTISGSPASVSINQGSSGVSVITTAISGGFNSAVALSATGQPSGVTVSFSPATIVAPGAGKSIMTISITPTTPVGTYSITVPGTGGGITHTAAVALTVLSAVTITTTSLPDALIGVPYSATMVAVGGTAPYTWTLTSRRMPQGLILNPQSGQISGTAIVQSAVVMTLSATDSTIPTPQTSSVTLTLNVTAAPLSITTASLPNGQTGVPYAATLGAANGVAPYFWQLVSGTLPAGLTFNALTGLIGGTPIAAITNSPLTYRVTDSTTPSPQTATASLTLTITAAPLTIATTSLPNGQTGVPYSTQLTAAGGIAPYGWQLGSSTLPAGLTLNTQTGQINGTPAAGVTNTALTFKVIDSTTPVAQTASASLTLTVTSVSLVITTAALPNGQTGVPYSAQLGASGGVTPYSWQVISGTLPAGLSLNAQTGQIAGTPTVSVANTPLTFKATDSTTPVPLSTSAILTLSITPAVAPLTITTASLPNGQAGVLYSAALAAGGGTTPYGWQLVSGTLPAGLIFNGQTGQISGTPGSATNALLTFKVTDATTPLAQTATVNLTLAIVPAPATLTVLTQSLPDGQTSAPYSAGLTAAGGVLPYTWSLNSGRMPPGLTLNPQTGQITGIPIATLTNSLLRFGVTDSTHPVSQTAVVSLVLNVAAFSAPTTLTITTTSLPNGQPGLPYSALLAATGGNPPYNWQLISGTLPAGLTLNGQTGLIGGTPTSVTANAPLTFKVTDATTAAPQTAAVNLTLSITSAPIMLTITTASLPDGISGVSYSATLTAIGGSTPYTWALVSGRIPFGLTLNTQTGQISGTPFASLTNTILTFRVTDSTNPAAQTATVSLVLNIL